MRILVVFYSLTGHTRKVAERAARDISADVAEVRSARYERGVFRFIRAAIDSARGWLPEIEVSGESPEQYDFVLVLAPVWAGHASTPIRMYLAQNSGRFKRAAFVLTCGGRCPPRAFEELADLSGVKPEAELTLLDRDIKKSVETPPALASLLASVTQKAAA